MQTGVRRNRAVDSRRTHAGLRLMQLEAAKILSRGRIRRTAEEGCEAPHVTDIVVARLLDEVAHGHVFDHAPAQRADGLLTHRGAPVSRWRFLNPSILKTGRPACHPVPLTWSLRRCRRTCLRAQRAPAKAGSFCGPERRKTMSARMS